MRRRTSIAGTARTAVCLIALSGLVLGSAGAAGAAPAAGSDPLAVPQSVRDATTRTGVVAPALRGATGSVTVSVRLSEVPLAAAVADGAIPAGTLPDTATQRARTAAVRGQQDRFMTAAARLGARELGRSALAANVVAVQVDAAKVADLAALPGVVSVKPVAKYEIHEDASQSGSLAQAAQYVQAAPVWAEGYSGKGVTVAVLDSGADYTHRNLGGPGTTAAYDACYAQRDVAPRGGCAKLFGPGAPKVVGGYDFIGESWNGSTVTDLSPDPNPIDFEGHGTHVIDISTGHSADDTHRGIAYGADVLALKVCSAVATACSGVALLQAVDYALDPNGDGNMDDAANVMNLSLGSSYGQPQDDLTVAVDNAVRAGIVAVISAGNSADRPFIVGSPSTAARAISVAQTALPDDALYPIKVVSPIIPSLQDNTVRFSVLQPWGAPLTSTITGTLAQPVPNLGCAASDFSSFPAGSVALIMRGSCAASLKAQNAQAAGATAAVIWNNVPGDPPTFSFGGGEPVVIPTLTISMDAGQALVDADANGDVNVVIDPAAAISLTNTTVGTSSRGPRIADGAVKPDIGAPGAWLSAEVGTGNEETNFGGTSGAAPVVTGSAALVIDKFPGVPPAVIKSRLLNGASTENKTPDSNANLYPTPITRVGAGEVRVQPAADHRGVLLNTQQGSGNLSFGLPRLDTPRSYSIALKLGNTGRSTATYQLQSVFRDPADAATGAVRLDVPASVTVPAGAIRDVRATLTINPAKLPVWPFTGNAGSDGDGSTLNGPEYDGFVLATSSAETLHLGWQVLPRRSADVSADGKVALGASRTGTLSLTNRSAVQTGVANVYGLTGVSPRQPIPGPGDPGSAGSNVAVIDLDSVGVRDSLTSDRIQFAIAGRQRQAVPLYPAGYEVDIDTNRDGTPDYAVYQQEAGGFGSTGQSLVYVLNIGTGVATAYYYTIADFDSSTVVYTVPRSVLGLSRGKTFDFSVLAYDDYFSGLVTDSIAGMTWTVGQPRYSVEGGTDKVVVPPASTTQSLVTANVNPGPSTQFGLLLLFDRNLSTDAQAVPVTGGPPAP